MDTGSISTSAAPAVWFTSLVLVTFFSLEPGFSQSGLSPAGVTSNEVKVAPLTRDIYSGLPIGTMDRAYQIIRSRREFAPKKGEMAPDFDLSSYDSDRRHTLYELCREKPVVLIFASWGCDIFREANAGLVSLYHLYATQANFVFVYIREAHPLDFEGSSPLGRADDPKSLEERKETAARCREQMRIPFLMLVDEMDDPCATRWAAWPVRCFVVEPDRRIGYAGAQGPWGFRPYRGYVHGSGKQHEADSGYHWITLEEYLEIRFPKQALSQGPSANGQDPTLAHPVSPQATRP